MPEHQDRLDASALIVTGAHLLAEVHDRPWAYWLAERLRAALGEVVVCSDLWYLNRDELRGLPVVSIGAPGVNALSAYFASRLPSVLAVEGVMVVQMATELDAPQACCWGRDEEATGAAVQAFAERHLEAFVDAVAP